MRQLNDTLCIENGLSIVENPQRHGKRYNKWLGDQAKPSNRELLRVAIDTTLAQKPTDFDALLKLFREAGYEVKLGKIPSLRDKDQKRFIRLLTEGLAKAQGITETLKAADPMMWTGRMNNIRACRC